jgi:hypothetical protein
MELEEDPAWLEETCSKCGIEKGNEVPIKDKIDPNAAEWAYYVRGTYSIRLCPSCAKVIVHEI